ncbi:lysozyme [uncultured Fusobacterium sp.]|uniref:lysozyme n=1 Tax=uncultured Fusobacterium sp. TaxID=159267 RepID=UPI0025FDFF43|nr:lysozyme [uncultured Fusobacterium sp.]
MKISEKGIEFIIKEEGEVLHAYRCQAGIWTIGVGHTGGVTPDMRITRVQSRELLKSDLKRFEKAVNDTIKHPLLQHQFDALVSFTFNVGAAAFKASTLAKKINTNSPWAEIRHEFLRWNKVKGKENAGLTSRRKREAKLYYGE